MLSPLLLRVVSVFGSVKPMGLKLSLFSYAESTPFKPTFPVGTTYPCVDCASILSGIPSSSASISK